VLLAYLHGSCIDGGQRQCGAAANRADESDGNWKSPCWHDAHISDDALYKSIPNCELGSSKQWMRCCQQCLFGDEWNISPVADDLMKKSAC